jgi:hypothetical protein
MKRRWYGMNACGGKSAAECKSCREGKAAVRQRQHRVIPVIESVREGNELFCISLEKNEPSYAKIRSGIYEIKASLTSNVLPLTVPSAWKIAHCVQALHASTGTKSAAASGSMA